MSSHEMDFLRNQVERLNALLGKYQERFSLSLPEDIDSLNFHRPWITNQELISPLMHEYDAILQQLQSDSDEYKGQIINCKHQLEELVTENERLRNDLKEVVSLGGDSAAKSTEGAAAGSPSYANLQQQLKMALQEKEACQQKWREATQELDRVQAELRVTKDSYQLRSVEKKAQELRDQYSQSVATLNSELESLQSDLRKVRQELSESQRQVLELKKTNYTLQQQLSQRDDERAEGIFKEGITDSKVAELQRLMEELRQRVVNANREAEEYKREKSLAEARLAEATRRLVDTEQREIEAIEQVREAITLAETSVLEKDQAEIQKRQKNEEVSSLQNSLARIVEEAGARTRREVDNVRKQFNDRVTKLTEELQALELENTEKQAQTERLVREKRALDSELSKACQESRQEGARVKSVVEDLSRRVSEAERSRDDLLMKVENLSQALDKERAENMQMKESYDIKVQALQERLSRVQQEYDSANDDRLRHVDAINSLTKRLQQAEQERDGVQRKFMKELALIEQEQQTKSRGFEVQLQTTEDARRTSSQELKKLLGAQQRMCARWKEECQTITHKFEGKIEEMRAEMTQLRQRNEQLTSLLKESQTKTADAEKLMREYTRNIQRMEARMIKAETHTADITKQMSRHHTKERQLVSERQSLINELTRSQRDKTMNASTADPYNHSPIHLDDLHSSR